MDELEKLVELLETIDASLKENEASISKIKEEISNIKNEELDLKKLYPDLCEVEQVRIDIEMNKKNMEECEENDKDTIRAFEQKIESLQNYLMSILDKLKKNAILSKKEYEDEMNNIKERELKIPEMEAQINEKEKETERLIEQKKSTQDKIDKLKVVDRKNEDYANLNEVDNLLKDDALKESSLDSDKFLSSAETDSYTKDVIKRDLTKNKNVVKTSEIASFIGYEEDTVDEKDESEIKKPQKKKKEYSIDYLVDSVLRKQDGIARKFEEILQESKDNNLNKNVIYLKNKFEQRIYNILLDASNKFMNKRKEIDDIRKELKNFTDENEEERLEKINNQLVEDISKIESVETKYRKEIIDDFNSFEDFVKKEFDYLYTLEENVKNRVNEVWSDIYSIDGKLQEIKENSKESILEAIKKVDKELEAVNKEQKNLEQVTKDKVVGLLDETKNSVKGSYDYQEFVSVISELKLKIDEKINEISDKISEIEEKRMGLESGRRGLEEKYNFKKKNDDDKEEELALANQKEKLKEGAKKIGDMLILLKNKYEKFEKQSDEEKLRIKSNIKRRDMDISNKKISVLERVNYSKKSPAIRLFEGINEYNNEYTGEFERYAKKIQGEINEIQKENDEYKKGATNIVVVSEFEENFQLLSELKKILDQIIESNKYIENQGEKPDEIQTSIKQEIEKNVSLINPQDTINSKIDFREIYQMEDKIRDVDKIGQSVAQLYQELDIKEDIAEASINEEETKIQEDEKQEGSPYIEEDQAKKEEISKNEDEDIEKNNEEEIDQLEKIEIGESKIGDSAKERNKRKNSNMDGLEEYSDSTREVLLNIPWSQLIELKNMNKEYQRILYIEDLKELKNEKVQNIAKLKEQYKSAVEYAKKLYEMKKYVLAYKKGMEEMAKERKNEDKESKKEHSNIMKIVGKSVKMMKESGISGFEDFRDKVIKNSDMVKEILAKTKNENEELVKLMGLIQSIQRSEDMQKSGLQI